MHLTYFKRVIIRLNGFHRVLPSVMGLARIKSSFSVLCSLCLPGKRRTTFCGFLWVFVGFFLYWLPSVFFFNGFLNLFLLTSRTESFALFQVTTAMSKRVEVLLRVDDIRQRRTCFGGRGNSSPTRSSSLIGFCFVLFSSLLFFTQNFFSKRSFKSNPLKRTKSISKLERKRTVLDPNP